MKTAQELFNSLSPEVRDSPWRSNCAGEVFVEDGTDQRLRIGHFQGDADIAAFVVAAQAQARQAIRVTQRLGNDVAELAADPALAATRGLIFAGPHTD